MGNYRFKLADMMPNSWFYKLKEKGNRGNSKKKGQTSRTAARDSIGTERPTPPSLFSPASRPSNYVTSKDREENHPNPPTHTKAMDTLFPLDTPTKSKKNAQKKPLLSSTKLIPTLISPLPDSEFHVSKPLLNSESILNVISDRELHPIMTKSNSGKGDNDRNLTSKQGYFVRQSNTGKSPPGLRRAKIRMNSPRLAKRRVQASTIGKVGLKESMAVVKSSADPQKDFRESMVEMIVENNLLASKDLEELLACYLSLNSHDYHDMIVEVFQQVWIALLG